MFFNKYENPFDALADEYWEVRLSAYRALGFTEKALDDDAWGIRL